MNVRRFVLRLIVGLLCFCVGWASAVLLGASRAPRRVPRAKANFEFYLPHTEAPPPPRFEFAHPRQHGCEAFRVRPAHKWDAHEMREPLPGEHFFLDVPPPPPPPKPRRAPR